VLSLWRIATRHRPPRNRFGPRHREVSGGSLAGAGRLPNVTSGDTEQGMLQ
jgi:hypothetical protein